MYSHFAKLRFDKNSSTIDAIITLFKLGLCENVLTKGALEVRGNMNLECGIEYLDQYTLKILLTLPAPWILLTTDSL